MSKSPKLDVSESEQDLVETAREAVSQSNWVVGECAAKWTVKFARGRTDGDFANMVGLSPDQVFQRRRVWETFGDVQDQYPQLKWSHFYVALNWDDAPECLQWAHENEATVAEMRAWRRAQNGEDLTQEATEDEWSSDPSAWVSGEHVEVRDPDEFQSGGGQSRPASDREAAEVVAGVPRASEGAPGDNYSPFRSGAGSPAPGSEGPEVAVLPKPKPSAEQILQRLTSTLERLNKSLTPEITREFRKLPEKKRNRMLQAVSELNSIIASAGL